MSVSSIFTSAGAADPLSALYAPSTTPSTSSADAASSSGASALTSAASATSVSGSGSLLSQLQQLSFSNPAAFKEATAGYCHPASVGRPADRRQCRAVAFQPCREVFSRHHRPAICRR